MIGLQLDLILKREKLSKHLIDKLADLYGIEAKVHRIIDVDPTTGKRDDMLDAYGYKNSTYNPVSERVEAMSVKMLVGQSQLHYLYNGSSANILLILSKPDTILIGDQVEFHINRRRFLYHVREPIETYYDIYFRVTLTPQLSLREVDDV